MRLELTKNEMLALWKRRHFLEPLRADCRIERSDGVDLDAIATEEMRLWYLKQLAEAPPDMLAPSDLAMTAKVRRSPQGTGLITLPGNVVRVIAVRLAAGNARQGYSPPEAVMNNVPGTALHAEAWPTPRQCYAQATSLNYSRSTRHTPSRWSTSLQ